MSKSQNIDLIAFEAIVDTIESGKIINPKENLYKGYKTKLEAFSTIGEGLIQSKTHGKLLLRSMLDSLSSPEYIKALERIIIKFAESGLDQIREKIEEYLLSKNLTIEGLFTRAFANAIILNNLIINLDTNEDYTALDILNNAANNYERTIDMTGQLVCGLILSHETLIRFDKRFSLQELRIFLHIGKNEKRSDFSATKIKNHFDKEITLNATGKTLKKFVRQNYLQELPSHETVNPDFRKTFYGLTPDGWLFYDKLKRELGPYLQD